MLYKTLSTLLYHSRHSLKYPEMLTRDQIETNFGSGYISTGVLHFVMPW